MHDTIKVTGNSGPHSGVTICNTLIYNNFVAFDIDPKHFFEYR